ncbi:MAG: hypothetical protein EHM49_00390 [Deltaproteobacteria bacterium]|nr:MAG: hypothetical protein EHM49_00390 [Deltaproteobacteria bacterium]
MITLKILDPVHIETNMEGKANLNKLLSYQAYYWHTGKTKSGYGKKRVDYPVYLIQTLSNSKHIFLTGFLPKVINFLEELKMPYEITGEIPKVAYDPPDIPGIIYRPDQKRLIEAALENGRGVLQAPCGSGKGLILLALVKAFGQENILFLCHSVTIISQFKEELLKWGFNPKEIGVLSGSQNTTGRIQLASIQSFSKLIPKTYVDKYDVILTDECHGISSLKGMYGFVLQRTLAPVRIGVTATMPYRDEAIFALEGLIGPKLGELTVKEGNEIGIIAKPEIQIIEVPTIDGLEECRNYQDVYQVGVVENFTRNMLIFALAKKQVEKGKSVLINVNRLEHGYRLEALGNEWGLECKFIHGDADEDTRNRIKHALDSKETMCVIASTIFKEGVNIRSLDTCINAAGQKSEIATLQALGRGLRTTEDKKTVLIIDFKDMGHKYLRSHYRARYAIYKKNGWIEDPEEGAK